MISDLYIVSPLLHWNVSIYISRIHLHCIYRTDLFWIYKHFKTISNGFSYTLVTYTLYYTFSHIYPMYSTHDTYISTCIYNSTCIYIYTCIHEYIYIIYIEMIIYEDIENIWTRIKNYKPYKIRIIIPSMNRTPQMPPAELLDPRRLHVQSHR